MPRRSVENALFFREFVRNFHTTGAILPSGRFLANALTRYVREESDEPRNILEVGPGTGAITGRIIQRLGSADRLDLVELNEAFVRRLQKRFQGDASFRAVSDRTRILHCPVQQLPPNRNYHLIISGLPLNNFSVADVESILTALAGLLTPRGTLSFFEYIAMRPARAMIGGKAERVRLRGVARAIHKWLDGRELHREAVWMNVPPAWVHHVRL